jgi:hypothetical protein
MRGHGLVLVKLTAHFTLTLGVARLGSPSLVNRGGGGVAIFNRGPWVQWIPTRTKFSNRADGSSCLVLGVGDEFSVNRLVIRF